MLMIEQPKIDELAANHLFKSFDLRFLTPASNNTDVHRFKMITKEVAEIIKINQPVAPFRLSSTP